MAEVGSMGEAMGEAMAEPNLGPRLDLARFPPVNHLWPELVERVGLERSGRAVQQALDLQLLQHG